MAARSLSEKQRFRYLLGLSSPAEREHIESKYFEDENAFQEMVTAEDDLIDAYARGELVGEERRRFEKSFVSSLPGRDRVQFARAFAGAVSASPTSKTKVPGTLLNIFKTFQTCGLSRTARVAAVIIFVTVFAWVVSEHRRMTNEISDLRRESAELSKRAEALQQSRNTERTHTAEIVAQLADLQAQANLRHGKSRTITTRRARYFSEANNNRSKSASSKPEQVEKLINTQDASPGNSVMPPNVSNTGGTTVRGIATDPNGNIVSGATVTLTDSARTFTRTQCTNDEGAYIFNAVAPGTYSIKVSAPGFKTVSASGLTALADTPRVLDIQLELGAISETVTISAAAEAIINTQDATLGNFFEQQRITELPLKGSNVVGLLAVQRGVSRAGFVNGGRADQSNVTLDSVNADIRIPSALKWFRFQIVLEKAAIHEDYHVTIKTADGGLVTSVEWTEPLTPHQTIIDTPVILTGDLPPGNYVLLLMGKEPDGSFVKIAEYAFTIITN